MSSAANKKRGLRDWAKIDWEKVDDEWAEEDEAGDPTKLFTRDAEGNRVPNPYRQEPTKSEMAFVKVKTESRSETEDLGARLAALLSTAGVEVAAYPIEDDQILFVANGGAKPMTKAVAFLREQPEVSSVEWKPQGGGGMMGGMGMAGGNMPANLPPGFKMPPGMNMPGRPSEANQPTRKKKRKRAATNQADRKRTTRRRKAKKKRKQRHDEL